MAKENLAKKLRKLTQSSRKKVVKANAEFTVETLEKILKEVRSNAEKGRNEARYRINDDELSNPGDYSEKDLLNYFGEELCRKLTDMGFKAKFEYEFYREVSGGSMRDDCSPFGQDSYEPSTFHYITLEIGW